MKLQQSTHFSKRFLAWLLTLSLCLSLLLPSTAFAAQTGSSDTKRTVFDALGLDTGTPEGYEQEEGISATPFGKTYTTLAEVDELFVFNSNSNHKDGKSDQDPSKSAVSLVGNGTATGGSLSDFFQSATSKDPNFSGDAMLAVEGNFSTENNGLKKDIAILTYYSWYRSSYTNHLRLYTGDPVNNRYMSSAIRLPGGVGNNDDKKDNHFTEPYMPYSYLDLAVGDFDGDGIDEIAVYDGNYLTPAVTVWKLQKTSDDAFLTAGNWQKAWTRDLPKTNGLVPNMVSLAAADIDKDGIDDLAISYGYYKYQGTAQASKAVVLMGADNSQMMTRSYELSLGTVYRAGLTAGDIDNDGRSELMVGGSTSTTNRDARYLAIYGWNGTGFDKLAAQNINPTDDSSGLSDKYYMSLPYMAASLTVGKFYGLGDGLCIYMDSIILRYGTGGIEVLDLADKGTNYFYGTDFEGVNDHLFYVEWSARAADFTGSGQEAVGVNRMSLWVDEKDRDNAHMFAYNAVNADTFKNQHLNILSFGGSGQSRTVKNVYHQYADPSYSGMIDGEAYMTPRAVPFCLPNTDDDTIVLRYTGEHSYTYADPEVLAVLASPPYYADLANDDDDSQMIESKTSYGRSEGSGSGSSYSNSFSVGAYTSWEHTFSIFGVELFSAEAEAAINNTFTWETQKSSSIEYEVEYSTMAGMDSVVLYALPVETYVYEATMPDKTTQIMTVNLPYQPSVRTISAEEYEEVQRVYSDILPDISRALTHAIGNPGSYAPNESALPSDRSQTLVYKGDFAAVGQGSQNTTSQSIAMTSETEDSFNYDFDVETKAGVGMGGVTVGVTAGYSHGAGKVHVTTAGSTYSGELNGLPTQAKEYGYSFNWKLVGFLYQGKYPVVTYLVNSVTQPPLLPEKFGANEEETTTDRIALEWEYPGNAAGFIIYRYFQSPSSSGYYKIGTVEGDDYRSVTDGVKYYRFLDEGLSPNTGYQYRIQAIGLSHPNTSIPSEALRTYTKPETGAPQVAVSTNKLATYPDSKVSTTAYIENSDEFIHAKVYYQWQKQAARDSWETVANETAPTLTFQYPDFGVEGIYRCKVTALVDQNLITSYSPEVTVTFAQRASQLTDLTISGNTLTATVIGIGSTAKPTGTVRFILTAANAETIYTTQVDENGKASVTINPVADIYKVTATYSGSKVFLPASYDPSAPLFYTKGVQSGSYVDVRESYVYGDSFDFEKYIVKADGTFTKESFVPNDWKTVPDTGYENGNTIVKERFAAGRAGWIGKASFEEAGTTYTVTIQPRPIEVVGLEPHTFAYGKYSDSAMLDGVSVSNLVEDWAVADKMDSFRNQLILHFYNSAGTQSEAPVRTGAYTARIEKRAYLPGYGLMYNGNYDLTCPTVAVAITGATYEISAKVADGQENFGSVSVAYPANATNAATGQTVIFKAHPNAGYTVKAWYTVNGGTQTQINGSEGTETLTMTQTNAGLNIVVAFQKKNNTLTVYAQPENAGSVTTDAQFFSNGNAYTKGYKATFQAVSNPGWHFTGWSYLVNGQSPIYNDQPTFSVEMPDESVQLYAKFERDTYALTLGPHLTAYVNDTIITDLDAIPGDTQITIRPQPGFLLCEGAQWTVNGIALNPQPTDDAYTFTLTADTSISVDVAAQTFAVALDITGLTGGTATLTGVDPKGTAAAGTLVTFTAVPARGYAFQCWKDAHGAVVSTNASDSFTISAPMTLTPVFEALTGKSITLGEKIDWMITCDDRAVESDTLKLFPDEILTLTANPQNGDMVAGWTLNNQYSTRIDNTISYHYEDLADSNLILVSFQPITYFTVSFTDNISATADAHPIASGDLVAAGRPLVLTYHGTDAVTKWLDHGAVISGPRNPLTISALSSNLDLTVETGTLAFYTVTDTSSEPDKNYTAAVTGTYVQSDTYAENSMVTITVTPAKGYVITDILCDEATFTTDSNGIWTGTIDAITDHVAYTVTVKPIRTEFTITFDPNLGKLTGANTAKTDNTGRLAELPTDPTRDNYAFDGWFTQATGGEKVDVKMVYDQDTTLYAHWTKLTSSGGGGGGISTPGYPITGSNPEHGTVTISPKSAAKGDSVTITVAPDAGYQLGSIQAVDEKGHVLPLTSTGNGVYQFTMPASKVIVSATFEVKLQKDLFTDVAADAYYADAVTWAAAQQITTGVSATLFDPAGFCTRAQAVTFLWRAAGSPAPQSASTPFSDVTADSYYAEAVCWAVENGIVKGVRSDIFAPDQTCTRAQIVTFLWRANGSPAAQGVRFSDVPEQAFYAAAVKWAVSKRITDGIGNRLFAPGHQCTRAQIAVFLYRIEQNK